VGSNGTALAALIGRPIELPTEVTARFPELAAVRWRRGGVPVRVAGLFLGRPSAAAITLWRTVFLSPAAPIEPELLLHELRHVHQFESNPAFPLLYLWESLIHGYKRNRYEADARAYAAQRVGSQSTTSLV
jgi:Domain of unknown function (DUF4157)